ncbi:MAG: glycerol-3-phosphate dehydrogenase/oxidase [Rhizobiaceae bacterium]
MSETRDQRFARIAKNGAFDVIVVGGGINGIGAFREMSLQGLRVLLVERSDFCSGCSAAPSRMIHGGLRYLENGEFSLVRESLQERDALLKNAPHMVRKLPTTVPIRSVFSGLLNGVANFLHLPTKPAERGALMIKAGLMMYDWVTRRRRVLPKHDFQGRATTQKHWPRLRKDTRFSATYYDAWISHPERLGLELLDDAEAAQPESVAVNYVSLVTGSDNSLVLEDNESGQSWPVSASAIVNATGAWVDLTSAQLPGQSMPADQMVEGTKGSHLIIDNAELRDALGGHMIYFENADGRVCILFPYLSNVLVGATDIRVETPCRTRCEDAEKDYILKSLESVFPDIEIEPSQIVFSYSGIRPLPKSDQKFTGRISRSHFVRRIDGPVPQFCMIGGKWTTFRAFAEQTTDHVLKELGRSRKCGTLGMPIGGGRDYPDDIGEWVAETCSQFDVSEKRARHLLDHYGGKARQVLTSCNGAEVSSKLTDRCPYSSAEIAHLVRCERMVHLSDLVLRRTALAITGRVSNTVIEQLADIAARELGWNAARRKSEIASLTTELEDYYGVCPQTLKNRSI